MRRRAHPAARARYPRGAQGATREANAGDLQPGWACNHLNAHTFRALEFDRIRELLLQGAGSAAGKVRLGGLRPLTEPAAVREALVRTTEGRRLLEGAGRQPYHDLPDPGPALAGARVGGAQLEPRQLLDLASFIQGGVEIVQAVRRADEDSPRLARLASEVSDASDLAALLRRALLPTGEVADDASPRLADTRRTLARLRVQLTSVMEGYLRSRETERLLQDQVITTRNDRYVLLLKADHKGQLPGIIHGSSGTGASLFVEPLPAVELNNDIVSLQDEERREVARILRDLTARVGDRADELAKMTTILGELDAVQAMALLAGDMDAHAPEIVEDLGLELVDSRHPLLVPELAARLGITRAEEPVPVSLRAGDGEPVLVISGPNTGGKTVALKTVGLLALMAQCGLHVPAAAGSRLPVVRRVYADIGDDQSIAENLSTFSAHLAAIVEMTRDLARPALVLLDEVGAGTDPTEGGALGVAIVDHFRQSGSMVLATTHHGLMKAYAQSTPGVACASFGYDPETWEPTFRLTLGAPGRSLALEMAERLGLPADVVADARARRDDKEQQAEDLLTRLERDRAELEKEAARIAALRHEAEQARERAEAIEREIAAKKRRAVETFARELKRRGEEQEQNAAETIRAAVEKVEAAERAAKHAPRLRTQTVKALRAQRTEILKDPELEIPAEEPEVPGLPVAVGSRVRWTSLGITGEVLALHGDDEAELAVSGKRVRVPRSELVAVAGARPSGGGTSVAVADAPSKGAVPAEINLIGLTVEEALPRVDKLLDDASLSERREIRVIHGFGAGRLRKAVAGLLDGHPHVATWRQGHPNEGGGGATIVEIKD
jgi:DNA mismatch repair protein MutS2